MTFKFGAISSVMRPSTSALVLLGGLVLASCTDGEEFSLLKKAEPDAAVAPAAGQTTKLVERDVESPEVFSASESGLWDGRPSLGGVWAAHPDVDAPERVIIRNESNGKFVIGALFRRERDIPGPRIQVSSDAASALGMIAGAPVALNVTALRREEVPEEAPQVADATADVAVPAEVEETPLEPIAAASAAIAAAEAKQTSPAPVSKPAAQSEVAPKPQSSSLKKPYVQIGIFSVKSNADSAAAQMKAAGLNALTKKTTSGEKTFHRVLVGPASSKSALSAMTKKVHGIGFTDAYAVTN